jgi:hypothetical protein
MQLTIANVPLTGLVPEENVQGFDGVPESLLQEVAALNSASRAFVPRGNKKHTLTFSIQRVQADAETAAYFLLAHEAQFPVQGTFSYQTDAGTFYQPNAVAVVTKYTLTGATSTHTYRVVGGAWLTAPPSA